MAFTGGLLNSLADPRDGQEKQQPDYSCIVSSETPLITSSLPQRSGKGCRIITMMVILSKINLLNETDSLLSSQEPNDSTAFLAIEFQAEINVHYTVAIAEIAEDSRKT